MPELGEDIVEATWKEAARLGAEEARVETEALGRAQPHLVAFMARSLAASQREARELGLYLFFVVHRMFGRAGPGPVAEVPPERIAEAYARNLELLAKLEGAHQRFYERAATANQPHVMTYVVDAITEFGEAPGDAQISAEERARLYLALKVVVDAFDATDLG